jgi:hypothetical protein
MRNEWRFSNTKPERPGWYIVWCENVPHTWMEDSYWGGTHWSSRCAVLYWTERHRTEGGCRTSRAWLRPPSGADVSRALVNKMRISG